MRAIKVKKVIKRLNQIILVFPVWIVVGISGVFRSFDSGYWCKSEKIENYEGMY